MDVLREIEVPNDGWIGVKIGDGPARLEWVHESEDVKVVWKDGQND